MGIFGHFALATVIAAQTGTAAVISADSQRGERLFETQSCIQCHSVNGKGGSAAPDLGRRIGRGYTPALLVTTMWNHAPAMWAAMRQRQTPPPALTEQDAADLFAYFYSVQFFGKPGDAARGKRVFSSRHCVECHGIAESKIADARPVREWQALGNPIILASQMWNHSAHMKEAFDRKRIPWPLLTGQELTDVLVYLRNVREVRTQTPRFEISSGGEDGQVLFQSKSCAGCHTGRLALPPRLKGQNFTDIAVDMWNHAPKMAQPPPQLAPEEMSAIITYLWTQQLLEEAGNPVRGKQVFTEKQCASCHNDPASGAPTLAGRKGAFSAVSMVSALWLHGPRMLDRMTEKGVAWPQFRERQMSDLIAYLNSGQP
jgi:mono/diheme cytochrome c family protein